MSDEPQNPNPRRQKAPANLTMALLVMLGIAGAITIGGTILILLTPNIANIASEGLTEAGNGFAVGSAAPYPGTNNIKLTDTFRQNYDATSKAELLRLWRESVGLEPGQALKLQERVRVDYGLFATPDNTAKIVQFYNERLTKIGFKLFINETTDRFDRFGFASPNQREVITGTVTKPGSAALTSFTRFGIILPPDRNLLFISSASSS